MVSTRPPTSKSSSPFNSPLVTVPNAPIMICIIVTFMFHSFYPFRSKVGVLILLFTFFRFYSLIKVDNFECSLFLLLITIRSGFLAEIRWSVCISKSHRSLCVSFSRTAADVVHIRFVRMVKFKFLDISQLITCPPSCVQSYTHSPLICCIRL